MLSQLVERKLLPPYSVTYISVPGETLVGGGFKLPKAIMTTATVAAANITIGYRRFQMMLWTI